MVTKTTHSCTIKAHECMFVNVFSSMRLNKDKFANCRRVLVKSIRRRGCRTSQDSSTTSMNIRNDDSDNNAIHSDDKNYICNNDNNKGLLLGQ